MRETEREREREDGHNRENMVEMAGIREGEKGRGEERRLWWWWGFLWAQGVGKITDVHTMFWSTGQGLNNRELLFVQSCLLQLTLCLVLLKAQGSHSEMLPQQQQQHRSSLISQIVPPIDRPCCWWALMKKKKKTSRVKKFNWRALIFFLCRNIISHQPLRIHPCYLFF